MAPSTSPAPPRTAQELIDRAIRENRSNEWLLYGFAITFVAAGLIAIFWSLAAGMEWGAFGGAVCAGLFWPAMSMAERIRKQNLAIRLLEVPLSQAKTPKEASQLLRAFFASAFGMTKGPDGSGPTSD